MLPVKNGDAKSRYEEYEGLLVERDELNRQGESARIAYLRLFGQLITENFEIKLECIKCKKTIAYFQNALNHGGKIDSAAMQAYLDREMAAYNAELNRLLKDRERADQAKERSSYDVRRAKELYRRLVRLLHPDLNPETDKREELKELWQRIQIAHLANDIKELSDLEVLTRKALKELGISESRADIPDIGDRIEELKEEIDRIQRTEPYTYRYLLEDEEAVEKKKEELVRETGEYKKYQEELAQVITSMMSGGGLQIYVK